MPIENRNLTLRGLVAVAAAILAVAVIAIGFTIWALRVDAAADAARATGNISTVLAEQSARTVQSIDIVLADLRERIAAMGVVTADDMRNQTGTKDFHNMLVDRMARLPQAGASGVVDASGKLSNISTSWPTPKMDFSDREYFVEHARSDVRGLHISVPFQNRINSVWVVQFSRRINGPNGEFLGVVFIGVSTTYFKDIFSSIETLNNQKITLARSDGMIIVEHPAPDSVAGRKIPPDSPWYRLVSQGGGDFRAQDFADDEPRLTAVRPLQSYPLVVSVGVTEDSAFATWRRRAFFIGAGTLLIVVCSIFLLRALIGQLRKLLASERSLAVGKRNLAEKTAELERANIQFDAALNNITQGVCMFDEHARIVVFNQRYIEMYGLSRDIVKPGCSLRELIEHRKAVGLFKGDPKEYCEGIIATIKAGKTASNLIETTDGRTIYAVQQPMAGGGWVVTHEDITERKRAEAQTAFMARHDALTGLANRLHLHEKIEEEFARQRRNGDPFTVFAFDLDLFKAVNDSLGHPTGDALLKAVALRLRACTREHIDTIGRLGGDEFVLVQSVPEQQRENAIILANRLLEEISAPYEIDGQQIVIGTSIGIALAPNDGDTADELLKNADLALYRVKSEGRNGYRLFEPEMNDESQSRHILQADLRAALTRHEFELHYQTVFDAKSRLPCGAEALVRWRHPVRGMVPPAQFIQLAEDIGVIAPLGEWILQEACRTAVSWPPEIKLAVNLSAAQFRSHNLVDMVAATLASTGLPPERLELEITESVLLQKNANNLTVLYQLKSLGLSIVLDDFGTGYSSLSYLRMFPFDKIKIDRSFVSELSTRADCAAIVCAVVGLGHGLNIVTTAEGVETEEQLRLLQAAGVNQVQGFLLSRPRQSSGLDFHKSSRDVQAA
jgi:diguanylate cyclase (GGDEF)-like protein/PAS domain S-box-containing protein